MRERTRQYRTCFGAPRSAARVSTKKAVNETSRRLMEVTAAALALDLKSRRCGARQGATLVVIAPRETKVTTPHIDEDGLRQITMPMVQVLPAFGVPLVVAPIPY